jgi:hypothetical protein
MSEKKITINWSEEDNSRIFKDPKIKNIIEELPVVLAEITSIPDLDNPCIPKLVSKLSPTDKEKSQMEKDLLALLIDSANNSNITNNCLGSVYFTQINPTLRNDGDNLVIKVHFQKKIDDSLVLHCYYDIECNTVAFEIKKTTREGINTFNSNYKLIRPKYVGGTLEAGKLIFRPYADPARFFGRIPSILGYKRVATIKLENNFKNLIDLLTNPTDKSSVKIDASYETIQKLINKIQYNERDFNEKGELVFKVRSAFSTEENLHKHREMVQQKYRDYLENKSRLEPVIPIENLETYQKNITLGNDYIHPNQVRDIKRLSNLDSRFKLKKIVEVQQLLVDDSPGQAVKKITLNGHKKKYINRDVEKYVPVDFGYFTPFTLYDVLTTKIGPHYFRDLVGITTTNYRQWYEMIEEFKAKTLVFISLYNQLLLKASKFINISKSTRDQRGRQKSRPQFNQKDISNPINKIIVNLSNIYPGRSYTRQLTEKIEISFLSHYANEASKNVDIMIEHKLTVGPIITQKEIGIPSTISIVPNDLLYLSLIEGTIDSSLEEAIETRSSRVDEIASRIFGQKIENNTDVDGLGDEISGTFGEELSLITEEQLAEVKALFEKRQSDQKGRKTFAELATELSQSEEKPFSTSRFVPKIVAKKERVFKEEQEEQDEEFNLEDIALGGISSERREKSGASGAADPTRRSQLVKDIIKDPLMQYRIGQAELIWKRMQGKTKKGENKKQEIIDFFITETDKQLKKDGIPEDDLEFLVPLKYFELMAQDEIYFNLLNYLKRLQQIFNAKDTTQFDTLLTEEERVITAKFFDGERYRRVEERADAIEEALKLLNSYSTSIARQAINDNLKKCENKQYTNYMKIKFSISDENVPPCQGGELVKSKKLTDLLEVDLDSFVESDLKNIGISVAGEVNGDLYKRKIEELFNDILGITKVEGRDQRRKGDKGAQGAQGAQGAKETREPRKLTGNEIIREGMTGSKAEKTEFINLIFTRLNTNRNLSLLKALDQRQGVVVDERDSKIDILEYELSLFKEGDLGDLVIKNSGRDSEYKTKIKRIYNKLPTSKTQDDPLKDRFVKALFDKMISREEGIPLKTFSGALQEIFAERREESGDKAKKDREIKAIKDRNRISQKQAETVWVLINQNGMPEREAVKQARKSGGGDYEKYLKYKTKYLSMVRKLEKLGISL